MDAVEFLKERSRMYKSGAAAPTLGLKDDYDPEGVVKIVEAWSAAHPRKTRQSVFLEQYPEARIIEDGVLCICPANVSAEYRDQSRCLARLCSSCRRKFWGQGVE